MELARNQPRRPHPDETAIRSAAGRERKPSGAGRERSPWRTCHDQGVRFVAWLFTNAVALAVALWLVPGIWIAGPTHGSDEIKHKLLRLVIVAAILGAVSYVVKPVLTILSIPAIIVTLGLFLLVINAAMLGLTSWLTSGTDLGFHVGGFWAAIWGGLVFAIAGAITRRVIA